MKDLFANVTKNEPVTVGDHLIALPILYRRMDAFFATYGADLRAVSALLPSSRLAPIKVWPGRALVALNAFNYVDTDIGPYGEFSVGVPCTLTHAGRRRFGVYVHRLPVTIDAAFQAGVRLWGYPKFVCDMSFESGADNLVTLEQDDTLILELRVEKGGLGIGLARSMTTFTVLDGDLIETVVNFQAVARVVPHGLAAINYGPHHMGAELASLGLGSRPIATGELLDLKMALPAGQNLGPAGGT